jgi:glycosyltransferase involved in cell wall biosynthesis
MKVLFLERVILNYRVPFYNALSEFVDVTVAHYMEDKTNDADCKFKKIKVESIRFGPFHFQKGVRGLAEQYDVVSITSNIHAIGYIRLPFKKRSFKLITWGIGFRVSHSHPYHVYRSHNILDKIMLRVLSKGDANVFYMSEAKKFWEKTTLNMDKVFIAPNTVEVADVHFDHKKKKNIIFVGTLYRGKGVDCLLKCFREAIDIVNNSVHVDIIGDGPCRQELEELTNQLKLNDNVTFHGAIYDIQQLTDFYSKAILCISPYQAGLTVCTSMGNGVTFVTRKDAITGGELYHITNGENGIIFERDEELIEIIKDVITNPSKYIEMGIKAKEYYDTHATINHMVNGFLSAIEYVNKIK